VFVCIVILYILYIFNCTQTSSSFYCSAYVGVNIVNTLVCFRTIWKRKDISGVMVRTVGKYVHNYSRYASVVKTPEEKQFKGWTKY
jgi:hypothetical protein